MTTTPSTTEALRDFPLGRDRIVDCGMFGGITWVCAHSPIPNIYNGYVRVPDGHPWLDVETPENIDNSVPWGAITFDVGNWFGFDTMHGGQWWPDSPISRRPHDVVMTVDKVIGWAQLLARDAHNRLTTGDYQI